MVSFNGSTPQELPSQIWQTTWSNRSSVLDTNGLTESELNELGYVTVVFENTIPQGYCIAGYQFVSGNTWRYILAEVQPIQSSQRITRLQFLNLFTDAELVQIYTASKTNVDVEIALDKIRASEYIIKTDSTIVSAVSEFETLGLIATGRGAQILS